MSEKSSSRTTVHLCKGMCGGQFYNAQLSQVFLLLIQYRTANFCQGQNYLLNIFFFNFDAEPEIFIFFTRHSM